MNKKWDLTWGDSVAVRQAFLEHVSCLPITLGFKDLEELDYTPFNGDAKLIQETASIVKRQTGLEYKHIFLTNGATGGCTIALRAYQKLGASVMGTNPPPFFPLYPAMAKAAGINDITHDGQHTLCLKRVFLLDSPANPSGQITNVPAWAGVDPVIWDSVYHNNVYMGLMVPVPKHDLAVGSYSKLTGLNGLRLGWIATNDDRVAGVIEKLVAAEYCGLDRLSMVLMNTLIDQFSACPDFWWSNFETAARHKLDNNRNEWSKLEKYFGDTSVPINGMFFYGPVDSSCKKLLAKSNILYQPGSNCGTNDGFGRFNIGQDCRLIADAVKAILKADKC